LPTFESRAFTRAGRTEFGESLGGKQYPKPKMAISGFAANGNPLPLITTTDAGADDAGDQNVMVYSFRLCLTTNAANRVPFPKPANYDAARFEVVRRYFAQENRPILLWDLYPLPGGKFDANNGIGKQFSMGLVGACNGWSEADAAGRAKIWEAHKQYTLELYQFLTTDPAVPENLRQQLAELGLCRDEFAAYGHWSPQLYVREGRRMKGQYVVSQKDIMEEPGKDDPIVVSSFPIDSHDCQRVATKEGVINEGTIFPVHMAGRKHGYDLRMAYSAHETRATKLPLTIQSGGRKTEFTVDQTQRLPAGQVFRSLGAIELTRDVETTITLSNTGTDGFVVLDALQLVLIEP